MTLASGPPFLTRWSGTHRPYKAHNLVIARWTRVTATNLMIKILGPYTRKDGRQHIILYDTSDQSKKTVSYPKYLMQQYLGRELRNDETVDHINGDFTDNRFENMRVISRSENARTGKNENRKREILILICKYCKKEFQRAAAHERHNRKQGKDGPFCGKRCAGKVYN